jgi:hypothetical protein
MIIEASLAATPALIVDHPPGAQAFERDLPDAEIHLLDAGHFALDERNDEIASLILAFLAKHSV